MIKFLTCHCKKLLIGLFFVFQTIIGQELQEVAKLPKVINESSGIEMATKNTFWTFNDSGDKSRLFEIDKQGNLLRTVRIKNAHNRDWEDITRDTEGNLYIGNIGNNRNASRDLKIFKVKNSDLLKNTTVEASVISFFFEDQKAYPPKGNKMNFDCEAMFWANGNLYLFTKHRSYPTATNVYKIAAKPGNHSAKKIGTFKTGKKDGKKNAYGGFWITGGDISPDGKKICLVNEDKLYVFYDFKNDDFFGGKSKIFDLGKKTQKEAVCFGSNKEVFITDEYWSRSKKGGKLYKLKLDF